MDARFEMGEPRHQPKFEAVAMRDDERFVLTARAAGTPAELLD